MRIAVKVRPGAKTEKVERVTQPTLELGTKEMPVYSVSVKEPPEKGKANDAVVRVLADHFGVSRKSVRMVSGAVSRYKIFKITTSG